MNRELSDTIAREDDIDVARKSSPTIGIIALRFVTLLAAIVTLFVWAWSR